MPNEPMASERSASLAVPADPLETVERVEVLPFHKMGEYKWQELGLQYELANTPSPSPEAVQQAKQIFSSRGLRVV